MLTLAWVQVSKMTVVGSKKKTNSVSNFIDDSRIKEGKTETLMKHPDGF